MLCFHGRPNLLKTRNCSTGSRKAEAKVHIPPGANVGIVASDWPLGPPFASDSLNRPQHTSFTETSNSLTSVTRSTHPRDGVALSYSRRWRQAGSPTQPVRGSLQENVLPCRPVLLLHLHARLSALSRLSRLLVSENRQLEHKRSSEQACLEPMAHT